MIEVTKMFSHYNFCKIETTFQCLQGFQRVKVDEGVKLRTPRKAYENYAYWYSFSRSRFNFLFLRELSGSSCH